MGLADMFAATFVVTLGLMLGPAPAAAPNMALLDFLNRPAEILKSSVTVDSKANGGAAETLVGKQTDGSWSPAFKFDRRNIKTAPKKKLGNTFPAKPMPKKK